MVTRALLVSNSEKKNLNRVLLPLLSFKGKNKELFNYANKELFNYAVILISNAFLCILATFYFTWILHRFDLT